MPDEERNFIKNIYYMLAYAYHTLNPYGYKDIETESFDNIHDLFAAIMARGMSAQLKRGLHREYTEAMGMLATVRGRIEIEKSFPPISRHERRIVCSYDELTENCLFNRILKTAAFLLLRQDDVKDNNRYALKSVLKYFSSVDSIEPVFIKWKSFRFQHNNYSYHMLMGICYLILHDMLLTETPGKQKLMSFIDDQRISRLYEKFILEYFKRHYPFYNAAPKMIEWDTNDKNSYLPSMQTDVYLSDKKAGKRLIIDAKYYRNIFLRYYGNDILHSAHLYQIYSYVKNDDKGRTGYVSGMLLYAKRGEVDTGQFDYMIGDNRISIRLLDLNQDFSMIKGQLDMIISDWTMAKGREMKVDVNRQELKDWQGVCSESE
jgi:5-methylcytosine-specific restriction enzyme subunit McrC